MGKLKMICTVPRPHLLGRALISAFLDYRVFSAPVATGQHLCKFIGTKESVRIRKVFNAHRIGLGHQHGRRFIVLGHQYGRLVVMSYLSLE